MFHQILVITFKGKVGLAVQTPLLLSITTWKVHPLADLFHEQVRCGSFPLDAALIHMCHHPKLDCIYIYIYLYVYIYIYVYMYPYWGMVMNALVGICRPTNYQDSHHGMDDQTMYHVFILADMLIASSFLPTCQQYKFGGSIWRQSADFF